MVYKCEIEGPCELNVIAAQIKMPKRTTVPTGRDVQKILECLFPDASRIHIQYLLHIQKTRHYAQVDSVLIWAHPYFKHGGEGAPRVVKFSHKDRVRQESENYHKLSRFIHSNRVALLQGDAYSHEIGGICYSLLGIGTQGAFKHFSDIFFDRSQSTQQIIEMIECFLDETFANIHENAHSVNLDLIAHYTDVLSLDPSKLIGIIQQLDPALLTATHLRFDGVDGIFLNPIDWILSNQGSSYRFYTNTRVCLCHGDLHSNNMLVDPNGHFWLIDFAKVGRSHALRDFVELETDIKFNLLQGIDLRTFYRLENELMLFTHFRQLPVVDAIPNVFDNPEINRTYKIVLALRRIAADRLGLRGNMEEYYLALLMNTLKVVCLSHIRRGNKECAILSAALLCECLRNRPLRDFHAALEFSDMPQRAIFKHVLLERMFFMERELVYADLGYSQLIWTYMVVAFVTISLIFMLCWWPFVCI